MSILDNLAQFRDRLKAFAARYRLTLHIIASFVFFAGLYVSITYLDINLTKLSYGPLLIILFMTQPLLIFLNSLELKLCANASVAKMTIGESVHVSSSATIANILPLPAGLVLRGAALVKGGGGLNVVSKVLLIAALMWVAVAVTVSGAVIASGYLSLLVILLGSVAIVSLLFYASRLSDIKTAMGFLIIRALMVGILTLQLKLCFDVLGDSVSLNDAAVYIVSGVAGAVVSIVPAGLGIVEGFGAFLAKLDGASAPMAYVVLSLNRLIGLGLAGLTVLVLSRSRKLPARFESQ